MTLGHSRTLLAIGQMRALAAANPRRAEHVLRRSASKGQSKLGVYVLDITRCTCERNATGLLTRMIIRSGCATFFVDTLRRWRTS